ncbi:MAG: V-type ATP synthase subunit E [Eubacteriales bacterium]|nr:V-type ATP synthase subunit E [Eubacteriales bacterium]
MAGLELITGKIISDAVMTAESKKADALELIEGIKAEYSAEEEKIKAKAAEDIAAVNEQAEESAKALLNAKEREAILATENAVVAEIIAEAKARIMNLSTDEYFALLTEIYKNNAEDMEGEILLSAEDKKNMPQDFVESLSKIKGKLTLSDEDLGQKGFVVRYGRVELNCTFDAIFEDKYNTFSDIASGCCKE